MSNSPIDDLSDDDVHELHSDFTLYEQYQLKDSELSKKNEIYINKIFDLLTNLNQKINDMEKIFAKINLPETSFRPININYDSDVIDIINKNLDDRISNVTNIFVDRVNQLEHKCNKHMRAMNRYAR